MKQQWKTNLPELIENDIPEIGLSIIPVNSIKEPWEKWKMYQTEISPITEWFSHYINQGYVGIIAGRVSGNIECIDVDVKNDPTKTIWVEYRKRIPDELFNRLIVQTTHNEGFHLLYRCPEATIEKNQKLALHTNQEVIIETRGEGGYFCTSKTDYRVIQGLLDLENLDFEIPVITPEERNFLLETARSLTRFFPSITDSENNKPFVYKEQAINEFNNKYPIIDLFTIHGWSVTNEDGEKYYLLRDGSLATHSGYYFKNSKTFICFSTSTEFKPEKPYNHFQVLEILEGKNDYRATIRLLSDYGYSVTVKKEKITSDDISEYLISTGVRYDSFIQDLTLNGIIIEEREYNTLYIDLKNHFDKEIPRTRFEEIVKSNYITTINPIKDFIEANKDRKPIGTFEIWLDCITLKNKSVNKEVVLHFLKKWYVGMVAQALGGEFPNEFFLTLLSDVQGIGKTTFLRNYTLPKELQNYRKEHSLSSDDDFQVIMSQSLLVIDDEMDSRTYDAEKTFKNILSKSDLTMRRKYDRRISTIKRRCSFAGSGNNLHVIREQENRRIISIEIENFDYKKLSQVDYIDLFMEAYNMFEEGYQYSYLPTDRHKLNELNEDYVIISDVDMILDDYLSIPESDKDIHLISMVEMITSLSIQFPHFSKRINVPTIGKLMKELGYTSVRKGKSKTTCYEISKQSKLLNINGGIGSITL